MVGQIGLTEETSTILISSLILDIMLLHWRILRWLFVKHCNRSSTAKFSKYIALFSKNSWKFLNGLRFKIDTRFYHLLNVIASNFLAKIINTIVFRDSIGSSNFFNVRKWFFILSINFLARRKISDWW